MDANANEMKQKRTAGRMEWEALHCGVCVCAVAVAVVVVGVVVTTFETVGTVADVVYSGSTSGSRKDQSGGSSIERNCL